MRSHPNYEKGGSVAHRLTVANQTIAELEARQLASHDPLITLIARTVLEARRIAKPAAGSTPTDQDGPRSAPASRAPQGGDPRLRRALDTLEKRLLDAVKGWESKMERIDSPRDPVTDHHPHEREPKWPTVRCRRQDCQDRGRRVPSVVVDSDGVVPVWYCPSCGSEYPNHPVAQ